jgi:murein DD-endopeptidase MepM/ murein hydrolase activator NlpD
MATSDSQVAAAGRGRFIWPTRGTLLSGFGPKPGGQRNDGLDIAAADGTPVRAAAAGDVVYAGNLVPGFGNLVLVKHDDGWVTAYAHLSTTEVKIRDHVSQGTEIGTVGSSGGMDQPQLHFEVRYAPSPRERARPVDPALVLPVGQ